MISQDTFLLRSLLAPIVVPLIAFLWFLKEGPTGPHAEDAGNQIASGVAYFLIAASALGIAPYVWMLFDKREDLRQNRSWLLAEIIRSLPLSMLPYFFVFWGALALLCLVSVVGIGLCFYCVVVLIAGTIAVPVLGWIYVGITFAFLRFFQAVGLVTKETML